MNGLYERAAETRKMLHLAYESAYNELIGLIRDNGGLIDTRATDEKPTLYAMVDYSIGGKCEGIAIHGIRYDEDEGELFILTSTELDNYQADTGYYFDYYFNFDGEDKEHLDDAMKDITYFRPLDDGYTDVKWTILNIFAGLAEYLND